MVFHKEVVKHSLVTVMFAIETMSKQEFNSFKRSLHGMGIDHELVPELITAFTKVWENANDA